MLKFNPKGPIIVPKHGGNMEIESVDSTAVLKHNTNTKELELKIKKSLGIDDDKELTLEQANFYASLVSIRERWSIKEKDVQNSKIARPLHYIKKLKKLYPNAIEFVQGYKSGILKKEGYKSGELKKEEILQLHSNIDIFKRWTFLKFK